MIVTPRRAPPHRTHRLPFRSQSPSRNRSSVASAVTAAALSLCACCAACATSHPSLPAAGKPLPRAPIAAASTRAATESAAASPAGPEDRAFPKSPDVRHQVMAWAVLTDGRPLIRAVARVGGLAATDDGDRQELATKIVLARLLGIDPRVAVALDLKRAIALAVLSPSMSSETSTSLSPALPSSSSPSSSSSLSPPSSSPAPSSSSRASPSPSSSSPSPSSPPPSSLSPPSSPSPSPSSSSPSPFSSSLPPASLPPPSSTTPPASPVAATPALALLPIASPEALQRALTEASVRYVTRPYGLTFATERGPVFVGFRERYAVVASREELVGAAWDTLRPLVARPADAPLTLHLDAANFYAHYGPEVERSLQRFAGSISTELDPQLRFSLRAAHRLAGFGDSVADLELLVDADDQGVTFTARVDGKPGGAFAHYVEAQHPSAPWGLQLLPRDAVLVYATRRSGTTAQDDLDASIDYVGDAAVPPAGDAARAGWREAIRRLLVELPGEMVYAVWPGSDGGVGLGGAYRVRSDRARGAALEVYRRMGAQMAGVVAGTLRLDPKRFKVAVRVNHAAMRIGAVDADTVEVTVRWPRGATAERRLFHAMYGDRLVLGTAVVGEQALFAVGHDVRARLAAMIDAVAGDTAASISADPRFRSALAFHDGGRVSLAYLPTAAMAVYMDRVLRQGEVLAPTELRAMEPYLLDAGDGAIVATSNVSGARYEVSTHLPTSSLSGLPRIGAVMWRLALSPLLNPPTLPPLPLPPAHMTPLSPKPSSDENAADARRHL